LKAVNRSTSCLEEFKSFWKSTEEDEADPVSTPPESPESVVGAGDVGITDISKSGGDSITEVFDRIDTALKRLKPLVSINSEDPIQSELPVESAK
jgi:hypothetical protein